MDWFCLRVFRLRMDILYPIQLLRKSRMILKTIKISSYRRLTCWVQIRKPISLLLLRKLCPQNPVYLIELNNLIPLQGLISLGTQEIVGSIKLVRIGGAGNPRVSWTRSDRISFVMILLYMLLILLYMLNSLTCKYDFKCTWCLIRQTHSTLMERLITCWRFCLINFGHYTWIILVLC
jgi:hypothetical protein